MLRSVVLLAVTLNVVFSAPQFVSLKDGKIGVNFGGYHAEAGLGGLLTGNAAHGGLSASAGTPFGQEAAAGLGGILNGRAAGGAYAGATAGSNVGASAGLSGIAGGEVPNSGLGAEAHVGDVSHSVAGNAGGGFQITKQVTTAVQPPVEFEGRGEFYTSGNLAAASSANVNVAKETVVQKVKPSKKYVVEAAPSSTVVVEKHIEIPQVQAQVGVVAEAAPKVETKEIQTIQEVVPVKQTSIVTSKVETVPQQPFFNFQKAFDFNIGSRYAEVPQVVAPVAPVAPVVPVAAYNPQVFVYGKHFRPWHHRVHFQKHFAPIIYQPQVPQVVEKRKQVVVQSAPAPVPVPVSVPASSSSFAASAQGNINAGGLFDSIFNIPISTLKAVNGLLNTKVGGGFAVEKSAHLNLG